MAILSFRTSGYANSVYMTGNQRLTARDGCSGVSRTPDDYYPEVQKYANANFDLMALDNALAHGWINQQEYDETKAYGEMIPIKYPPGSSPVAPTE